MYIYIYIHINLLLCRMVGSESAEKRTALKVFKLICERSKWSKPLGQGFRRNSQTHQPHDHVISAVPLSRAQKDLLQY